MMGMRQMERRLIAGRPVVKRPMRTLAGGALCSFGILLASAAPGVAQEPGPDEAAVLATVEAALVAISNEDMVAFTDLMIDEAVMFAVVQRDGQTRYSARTRSGERTRSLAQDIVERGFDVEVRIAGGLATAWVPYDLYIDEEWSHCGIDAFTLISMPEGWRIASLAYSVEQPPACAPHPGGAPGR